MRQIYHSGAPASVFIVEMPGEYANLRVEKIKISR